MDKMREEFELEYWNSGIPPLMVGPRECFFARKDDGSYRLSHVDGAWWGWQASRAALCVEIPTIGEASSFGNWVVFDTDSVKEMLDNAGVSYK